jgi:predicted aspartyl protease
MLAVMRHHGFCPCSAGSCQAPYGVWVRRCLAVLALCLTSTSCGATTVRPPATTRMVKSIKPVPERGGRTLPFWLVGLEVHPRGKPHPGGRSTLAIVDTGARTTVIDRQFAETYGLSIESSKVFAKDFAGTALDTWIVRDVRFSIGEWTTKRVNVLVVELPSVLRDLGIGIIWSPQTSVPDGTMLRLNFTDGTLEVLDATELARGAPTVCSGPAADVPNASLLVDATIAGHPVCVDLDSGATALGLSSASAAGAALESLPDAASGERVGAGGSVPTVELPPQTVEVAGQQFQAPLSLSLASEPDGGPCASDGEIGLDVLKHCTVDLTADHFTLRCRRRSS